MTETGSESSAAGSATSWVEVSTPCAASSASAQSASADAGGTTPIQVTESRAGTSCASTSQLLAALPPRRRRTLSARSAESSAGKCGSSCSSSMYTPPHRTKLIGSCSGSSRSVATAASIAAREPLNRAVNPADSLSSRLLSES